MQSLMLLTTSSQKVINRLIASYSPYKKAITSEKNGKNNQ